MADHQKFHPTLAVSNVRNFIPINLEMEKGLYTSWAELFKIHCRVYQVLDHITPKSNSTDKETEKTDAEKELWSRLDAIVLQWIYGTISNELLQIIWQRTQLLRKHGKNWKTFFKIIRTHGLSTLRNNSPLFSWTISRP